MVNIINTLSKPTNSHFFTKTNLVLSLPRSLVMEKKGGSCNKVSIPILVSCIFIRSHDLYFQNKNTNKMRTAAIKSRRLSGFKWPPYNCVLTGARESMLEMPVVR